MTREVLVVEDEPDIRRLVVMHLERDGFRCRTAATGPDALREAQKAAPDLVVLDLMLPDLDGLEVCRQLRGDRRTAAVPIIMLTAKSDEVDRVVGLGDPPQGDAPEQSLPELLVGEQILDLGRADERR